MIIDKVKLCPSSVTAHVGVWMNSDVSHVTWSRQHCLKLVDAKFGHDSNSSGIMWAVRPANVRMAYSTDPHMVDKPQTPDPGVDAGPYSGPF